MFLAYRRQEPPLLAELTASLQDVVPRELGAGDTVLTNAPMREFFGEGLRRQSLFTYRGLFSGATTQAADRIFFSGAATSEPYDVVELGRAVEYRGFVYRLLRRIPLAGELELFVGAPVPDSGTDEVLLASPFVPRATVQKYLEWRRKNGLPIDGR